MISILYHPAFSEQRPDSLNLLFQSFRGSISPSKSLGKPLRAIFPLPPFLLFVAHWIFPLVQYHGCCSSMLLVSAQTFYSVSSLCGQKGDQVVPEKKGEFVKTKVDQVAFIMPLCITCTLQYLHPDHRVHQVVDEPVKQSQAAPWSQHSLPPSTALAHLRTLCHS